MPRPTSQDLAGYWDMLQLSVEDVSMKFDELHQLKLSDWKILESPERKVITAPRLRPVPDPEQNGLWQRCLSRAPRSATQGPA